MAKTLKYILTHANTHLYPDMHSIYPKLTPVLHVYPHLLIFTQTHTPPIQTNIYTHINTPMHIHAYSKTRSYLNTYIPQNINHMWLMSKHMGKPKQKYKTFRDYTESSQDAQKHHEYLRTVCTMLPSTEAACVASQLHWGQNSGHCPLKKEAFISRIQYLESSGPRCGSILLAPFALKQHVQVPTGNASYLHVSHLEPAGKFLAGG